MQTELSYNEGGETVAPLALLKQLIAIPSVNPMGRGVDGPDFLEERMSDFLVEFFRQLGLAQERIEVTPGRSRRGR